MQKKVHRKLNKKDLLVIVLTLYLFIMAFYYCFNLPIKSIVIKGNTNTLDEEIIKLGNINSYNKILGLNTKKVKNDIMENKAITSVKIKKQLNGTLLINVKEQNILFYNLLNKVYVYENGKTSENVSNKLGIPTLINYTPSDIYDNLIKKLNNINIDILKKVSEIEYSPDIKNEKVIDKNRFLLRMNDGNYVYINLANMDNLNKYEEIYATLDEKQKGILNLDSTSKGVVFQPFDLIKEKEEKKEAASVKEEDAVPTDLTEEQKYNFSYFATVAGLSQQIASALYMVMKKMKSTDQTSRVGNLIILGAEGSGKSTLGIRFAKTISEEKGEESVKIAKIYAEDFNKKDIPSTVAKIAGGTLIIEEAGDLDDAVVEQLSKAMEFRTDALLVVLEDEKKYLKELFEKHPDFAEKFTSEIVIPVFTNDELVEFGRTYAYEEDYTIDEEAIPTLYDRISELQEAGRPVTVIDVKEIVDEAIRQSEKIGFRKLSMVLSKKRYDADDRVILYEKDFR